MPVRPKILTIPVMCLVMATAACGSDDGSGSAELDCDLGNELSSTFADISASADRPTADSLEDVRSRLDDFDAPDEISDDVQAVKDGVDVFIEELASAEPDFEAISAAGESLSEGGRNIDAYLAENCG